MRSSFFRAIESLRMPRDARNAPGSKRRPGVRIIVGALAAVVLSGCHALNWNDEDSTGGDRSPLAKWVDRIGQEAASPSDRPNAEGETVRWDAGGAILGETDTCRFAPEGFVQTVDALLKEHRQQSVQRLVARYPDTALRVLQESASVADSSAAQMAIATAFDELFSSTNAGASFAQAVAFLQKEDGIHLLENRNRCWDALRSHRPDEVLKLKLSRSVSRRAGPLLEAEALRLEAIALMMKGRARDSVEKLERAIRLVGADQPYVVAHLKLLKGEFHRHADQLGPWKENWAQAADLQSRLLAERMIEDPAYWNRTAYLRPAGQSWPEVTIANFRHYVNSWQTIPETVVAKTNDESLVWLAMGLQHLSRDEGQNAVLAFKKAEAVASNQAVVPELQLQQARALISAGQPGAASAILIRLASADANAAALDDRAKAVLGSLKLQNGAILQGSNLIEDARRTADQWPAMDRLKTQADYALALLIRGREKDGVAMLEQTEAEFAAMGYWDQVLNCRENLVTYFEAQEKPDRLADAQTRLQELY